MLRRFEQYLTDREWQEVQAGVEVKLVPGPDGDVDLADLNALLVRYGVCVGDPYYRERADFDNSGCIDLPDLATLLSHYGDKI